MANEDHGHIALPKLYGAPAYARPPVEPVARAERPVDPDDLPLELMQTEEERELASQLSGQPYAVAAPAPPVPADQQGSGQLRGRPFSISALTGRFLGRDSTSSDAPRAGTSVTGTSVTFGVPASITGADPANGSQADSAARVAASPHGDEAPPYGNAAAEVAMAGAAMAGQAREGAQSAQAQPPAEPRA